MDASNASTFSTLIDQCCDGATEALRIAADRAIVADVFARMQTSGFDYGVVLERMLADAIGGPDRATRHYHFGRDRRPNPVAYGSGTIVALPGATGSSGGQAFSWLPLATRRRRIYGWSAPAGAWTLNAIHEEQDAAFTLAPGNYSVQFSGDVWSATQLPNHVVQIRPMLNGAPIATHSLTRANGATSALNPTIAVHFETANSIVVASPSVLTLVNPTAHDQNAVGLLRVVPT